MTRTKSHRRAWALVPVVSGLLLLAPTQASAHNAGHLVLPSGECHEVGSFKPAPNGLDLIPSTPFDEYGTSFAAFQGQTPILPGPCPS